MRSVPNGTLKWAYTTGGNVGSSPAIASDGTIYVGSWDGKLYAIHPDGTLQWAYTTGDHVGSSPAIAKDGTIYVGSNDNKLHALNPNGTLQWAYTTGVRCPPPRPSPRMGRSMSGPTMASSMRSMAPPSSPTRPGPCSITISGIRALPS